MYISEIFTTAPTDKRGDLESRTYQTLDKLKIPYERVDNDPAHTMEECEAIDQAMDVVVWKNIFLCNQKKTTFFLLVMPPNKELDTKVLEERIKVSKLSFASEDLMMKHLGTTSGSASIMGLMNDEDDYVQLLVDKEVVDAKYYGCNPGMNTSHLKIETKLVLEKFVPHTYHRVRVVEL